MTDEELVKALRVLAFVHNDGAITQAADRIEALVKEKEQLGREVNMARYGQPDFAWSIHEEAMADLEAKLAENEVRLRKAVEALENLADCVDLGCFCSEMQMASAMDIARTTLAEIKGESHE